MSSKSETLKRIVEDPQMLFGIIFVCLFIFGGIVIICVGSQAVLVPSSCSDELLPCWAFAVIFLVAGSFMILGTILFWMNDVWPYIKEKLK